MGTPMPEPTRSTPRWLGVLPLIYLIFGLAWILGSDLVVRWLYHDDIRALVYASTLKGALFVTLTSTLLYVLVTMRRADYATDPHKSDPFELRKPLIAFSLVGIGIASVGYVVYLLEAEGIRDRAGQQLEVSAQRAASEFILWHEGHVRSMRLVADSSFTTRTIAEWQADRSALLENLLRERLESIRASHDYAGVAAVAEDGTTLLAVGRPIQVTPDIRGNLGNVTSTKQVFSHWDTVRNADNGEQPVVDLMVAMRDRSVGEPLAVAAIIAQADIHWPLGAVAPRAADPHSEVTLVRLDGNEVGLLEPHAGAGMPRYEVIPRSNADQSVARAALGEPALFTAHDATGRAVLAAGHPVGETPWIAVATVGLATIEQQIQRLLLLIAGMSVLGFVATAALVVPWWRSVRAGAGVLIQEAESRADEMSVRLGWVTRHANEAILLFTLGGKVSDANARAEQVYGYSRQELLALSIFNLLPGDATHASAARSQIETLKRQGSLLFESTHRRKDGTTFPVEISARQVVVGGRKLLQGIVRDITERRRAEDKLRESEAQYRLLFRANPHPMWVFDDETLRFLAVNDAAIDHYGYSESEFLGMTIAEIRPGEDVAQLQSHLSEHRDELLQHSGTWRHCRKDRTMIDVEITSHKILFNERSARLVLANDVTSRLRAERAVRASEESYRSLFENASDGIIVLDANRHVLAANVEYQEMLGYSLQELSCIDLTMLLDEPEHARFESQLAALRHRQLPSPQTWVHRRKDGSRVACEVRLRFLPGGNTLATVRDLTEIHAARRRIERQRDLYDLLSQCNQAIVRDGDRQSLLNSVARLAVERGGFRFAWIGQVNDAGKINPVARFGDDRGYVAGLNLTIDPVNPEGNGPASRAIRTGTPVIVNDFLNDESMVRWRASAQECGIGASAAFPILTGGKVTQALMLYAAEAGYFDGEIAATLEEMTADVSHALDALRTRRDLEVNRLLIQSLINASDALVFAYDLEGRAIMMNEACARAMGGSSRKLVGCRRDAFMPRAVAHAHEMNDRRVIESGDNIVAEERNVESGIERVYLSVKYPLRDVEGCLYAVGGISTDITDLRRMQQELAETNLRLEEKVAERTREATEARVRAEAADRAKTIFLSSVSHELRSPLHSIIGFTSVLLEGLEGELTPAQQDHLRVVSEASHHLLAIINDLLDMSRIEAGAVSLELKPLPIRRLLERIMQRYKLQAHEKGLEFRLELADGDAWIDGDERRIEQIVSNLVSNAIKYTSTGSVVVSCRREAGRLRIDVCDTGPGIAAADQETLFERFVQLKRPHGSLTEGTGLGLAIASGLAEAMGGTIVLQSEPGAGSVFSLLLALEQEGSPS